MARRQKKKSRNYPYAIVFDENIEGVAGVLTAQSANDAAGACCQANKRRRAEELVGDQLEREAK